MKNLIFSIATAMATATAANAQIGINTETPKTTLDIVQKDQTTKGQGFRLDDGNQGAGKVLTSNADGTATWIAANTVHNVGNVPSGNVSMANNAYRYTGYNVTVPPGNSLLFMGVMVVNTTADSGYATFQVSESASSSIHTYVSSVPGLSGIPVSGKSSTQAQAASTGNVMFNLKNSSASNVTVYIWGILSGGLPNGLALGGRSSYAEPFIFVQQ